MQQRRALTALIALALALALFAAVDVVSATAGADDADAAAAGDVEAPGAAVDSDAPCDCRKLRYQKRKCRYNKQLAREAAEQCGAALKACETERARQIAGASAAADTCSGELKACAAERVRLDASVRNMVLDRQKREASDAEWRNLMRARAEACAPRDEPERVWVEKQQRCLEDKFECMRERADRELALRDCLNAHAPSGPANAHPAAAAAAASGAGGGAPLEVPIAVAGSTAAADAAAVLASIARADSAVGTAPGVASASALTAEAMSGVRWPRVSVLCPVCVKRHRWLPNLIAMFQHQQYPGELELVVLDGRCSKMPEVPALDSAFMRHVAAADPRVRYVLDPREEPLVIGAKRNWLVSNATGEVVVTFDVDDYYGPNYVARMVWLLQTSAPDTGMVKLHAWFSLGEGWLMDPPRRYRAYTYIDMEHDPMGWGWTYVFWRRVFTAHPGVIQYGEVDASEEPGLFHSLRNNGYKIATYADRWFLCLRIVTYSIVRTTGAGPCTANSRGCTNLPDFMVLHGFGGADKLKPWLDLWDARD